MQIERRVFALEGARIERRADGSPRLIGHAAVFDQLSEDLGGFRERILPGAFMEAIEKDDVRCLWNHDSNYILGRNRSGTLRLAEDRTGLAIDCDAPGTPTINDLVIAPIERGDVTHMSFGFKVRLDGQDWDYNEDGQVIRTLKRLYLFDVSPVVFPAYPQTDIAVRELRSWSDAQPKPPSAPSLLTRALEQQAGA